MLSTKSFHCFDYRVPIFVFELTCPSKRVMFSIYFGIDKVPLPAIW